MRKQNVRVDASKITPHTTICMLMYGDYHKLHCEALGGLIKSDLRHADVRIWCNVVCEQTFRLLARMPSLGWRIYVNDENRPKYKLMRDMFYSTRDPVNTEWFTWFDDDTLVTHPNWMTKTYDYLRRAINIDFCGQDTRPNYYKGSHEVVRSAPWFTGARFGKNLSRHIYGAYWWLKTEVMRELDWPDRRLSHNGGDWLLSEAIRQQGYKQVCYHPGIKVRLTQRRGLSEVSVGRRDKKLTNASDKRKISMTGKMSFYRTVLNECDIEYEKLDRHTITFRQPVAPMYDPSSVDYMSLRKKLYSQFRALPVLKKGSPKKKAKKPRRLDVSPVDLFRAKKTFWAKRKKRFGDKAVANVKEDRTKQADRIGAHLRKALDGKFFDHGLDYGCGYGRMLPHLAKHCGHIWAVDIMKDWVDRAGNSSRNVTPKLLNAFKLPVADNSVDFIADIMTTQGFSAEEQQIAYDEFERVAASGATVICLTKSSDGLGMLTRLDWADPPSCTYVKDIDQSGDEYCLIVGSLL